MCADLIPRVKCSCSCRGICPIYSRWIPPLPETPPLRSQRRLTIRLAPLTRNNVYAVIRKDPLETAKGSE